MNADQRGCRADDEITELVIGAAYQVVNTLGLGLLEKVYENAFFHELKKCDLQVWSSITNNHPRSSAANL